MKKDGTVDLRIKRTQTAIKDSFFKLVDERGFEHISVKDITDGAMISRNTFYLHYCDKYDLLDKICDELMRTLFFRVGKQVRRVQKGKLSVEGISSVLIHGFTVIKADRERYKTLFGSSCSDMFQRKLSAILSRCLDLASNEDGNMDILTREYLVSGIMGLISYYVSSDAEVIEDKCLEFTRINLGGIIEMANKRR